MITFLSVLTFIIPTILVAVCARFCLFLWYNRRLLRLARTLHYSTPALPLLGHSYHLIKGAVGSTQMALKEMKMNVMKGKYASVFWLGTYPLITISDPSDVQIILNSSKAFDGGVEHRLMHFMFGHGLLTAPANIWKIKRRHLNPVFRPGNLENYLETVNECGRDLILSLSAYTELLPATDISHCVLEVALKSSYALMFGPEETVDVKSNTFQRLVRETKRAAKLLGDRMFSFWVVPDILFQWLKKKDLDEIDKLWLEVLQDQMAISMEKARRRKRMNKHDINGEKTRTCLIDAFCTLEESMAEFKDEEVRHETFTFLVTGADTTTTTLSSCFLALAAHPHIQERLHSEISSVVGDEADVSLDNLREMPYLDQLLKETLRMFSPVSTFTRHVRQDLKLSFGVVPGGTTVLIPAVGLHFDPRNHPQPHIFDPERFTHNSAATRHKFSYLPFSGGPRNCIGKNFATMMMKVCIVHVIRKYKLSNNVDLQNLRFVAGFTTSSTDGYRVQVRRR